MPTYTYHCRECENDFDIKQSFRDDPLTDCVVCERRDSVHRVIQPAGIVFKGSGWYVKDHGSSSRRNNGKGSNGADNGSTEAKSEAKGEAKSETKSDTSTSDATSSASKSDS